MNKSTQLNPSRDELLALYRTMLLIRRCEEQLARCFLDGYATVRTVPAYWSVRWHTAAALLTERALRSVNRVRPAGLAHLAELLDEGLALASGDRGE